MGELNRVAAENTLVAQWAQMPRRFKFNLKDGVATG